MALLYNPDAFQGVPKQDIRRLMDKIDWLWDYRHEISHHPLRHDLTGYFKRRLGKYRIIYTYDPVPDDLIVCFTGLRDDIYEVPP